MPADLPTLQARLDALKTALTNGRSEISYAGRTTKYRSVAEIETAIKNVETDIAKLTGGSIQRTYFFTNCKGL
ncbi:phage head-tail joining protein [Bradyrhizobium sp. BR 10261]|uniref:phage head-tail joining protein n=1 Tax=Bradyrhizobium sp. BR 10261 TaxID=2749992 RepID=UPI001C65030C|nr:hypothetical protein [Bradyrhizobium sp. BR 10261]MBW7965308.1 hypothetical protein [Bradyrhizobium sp. BR 10261]